MILVMDDTISKTRFKARALEYFREVERSGRELVITDRGRPVVKLVPFKAEPGRSLLTLRESVVRYDAPTEPVGEEDWEALA
jgi:prevent-host-death family protein